MSTFDGRAYQARFDALALDGVDVHGEASMIRAMQPSTVLDAGCGSGRLAAELARHGVDVTGVDVDPSMIAEARRQWPALPWIEADLVSLRLTRRFEVVVMAGNVPLFCPADSRYDLVLACAAHVETGGALVAGFGLDRGYPLAEYDGACQDAGLVIEQRCATWDGQPFSDRDHYAVSVHRLPRQ